MGPELTQEPVAAASFSSGTSPSEIATGDSLALTVGDQAQLSPPSASMSTSVSANSASGPATATISTRYIDNGWFIVTVWSTPEFDALKVQTSSVTFGTAETRVPVDKHPNGVYMRKYDDWDRDGDQDVQLYFWAARLKTPSGQFPPFNSLYLTGMHFALGAIQGIPAGGTVAQPQPQPEPMSWSSTNAAVASVSATGQVSALAAGEAEIVYGNSSVGYTTYVKVVDAVMTQPVAPAAFAGEAELPRAWVDTRMPVQDGSVIRVPAGGDLQAALNRAQPGDVIELEAGAVYRGNFTLPAKQGTGWIVIRSSAHAQLPEGVRVTPADAPKMAKLVGGESNRRVLKTAPGAHHYRIVGLEIALAGSGLPSVVNTIVEFGADVSTPEEMPHHLVLDRTYVHGTPRQSLQRCVTLNGAWSAVVDSWLDECHAKGFDSQAIVGWEGTGPYKIVNNYLAGAGENVMFGGARPSVPGVIPSDIEIRRNHIHKPLSWKGVWTVKNAFELKSAQRVLFEGNVIENVWADAQVGYAVVLKTEAHGGWEQTSDLTFRNNQIQNSRFGFTAIGGASSSHETGSNRTSRLVVENNRFSLEGDRGLQLGGVKGIRLERNDWGKTAMLLEGREPTERLVMRYNLVGKVDGSSSSEGVGVLDQRAPGWIFEYNGVSAANRNPYPANNERISDLASYTGPAGVDRPALEAAVEGVRVGF